MDSKNQPSSSTGPDITTTVSNAGRGKEDDDEDINNPGKQSILKRLQLLRKSTETDKR